MKKPIQSRNTWDAVITAVLGITASVMATQGVDLDLAPSEILDAFKTKEGIALAMFVAFKLSTPIFKVYKRIKDGGFDVSKLKSRNLFFQVASLVSLLVGIFVKDAEAAGFLGAAILQIANFIWHRLESGSSNTAG